MLRITELHDLSRSPEGDFVTGGGAMPRRVAADALVSMNLWGFSPTILPSLQQAFERFLDTGPSERGECYLPDAVQGIMAKGEATVRVLPTADRWCGVTYAEDRPWVSAELADLRARGMYPEMLWP